MDGDSASRVRREVRLRSGAGCGMGALASAIEPVLIDAAGPGAECVSVSLEFASPPRAAEASLVVEAWVERATRTLLFVAAEAHAGGSPVVTASAIFSREGTR